jgi:hypothetical protein
MSETKFHTHTEPQAKFHRNKVRIYSLEKYRSGFQFSIEYIG